MIHELIDPNKKKSFKNTKVKNKNAKTLNECSIKGCWQNNSTTFFQSDSENKGSGSTSNTFIPPWLKNSLGLSQRNNENLDWSVCLPDFTALGHDAQDQKSAKNVDREEIISEKRGLKESATQDCTIRVTCEVKSSARDKREEITGDRTLGAPTSMDGKSATELWSIAKKESVDESASSHPESVFSKSIEFGVSHVKGVSSTHEKKKPKNDETNKLKIIKEKNNRARERDESDECSSITLKKKLEPLPSKIEEEMIKGYENKTISDVLNANYVEQEMTSRGKKCHGEDFLKLNAQKSHLQQEIKKQTENEQGIGKFVDCIAHNHLKSWLNVSETLCELDERKIENETVHSENKNLKVNRIAVFSEKGKNNGIIDKDSPKSTDEENDIKRFSEFLSKNKNIVEKRKCLEEVRNYFERKRRTRLTKRRCSDESAIPKSGNACRLGTKDDLPRERPKIERDQNAVCSAKERKSKFVPCNEEVVEKAVSETLQKFMSLYRLHVSPTMMGNMQKNILQSIHKDSLDEKLSNKSIEEYENRHQQLQKQQFHCAYGTVLKKLSENNALIINNKSFHSEPATETLTKSDIALLNVNDAINSRPLCRLAGKDARKNSFKTSVGSPRERESKISRENDVLENENFKRLKKEFENCLKSVQIHADGTGLRIQSVVLEREETFSSKGIRFVYNSSKKSLEFIQLDCDRSKPPSRGFCDGKRQKDGETQTAAELKIIKKSEKCQTDVTTCEACQQTTQTEGKILATRLAQTEPFDDRPKEADGIKDFEISPGLYRMVRSKDAGRFYLYPEKEELSETGVHSNATYDIHELGPESFCPNKIFKDSYASTDLKTLCKENCRGNYRRVKKKESEERACPKSNEDESLNCSFFKNSENEFHALANDVFENIEKCSPQEERIENICRDKHFGCLWFWNGEKISRDCGSKSQVENQLSGKLTELSDFRWTEISENNANESLQMNEKGRENEAAREKTSEVDLPQKTYVKDMFSFRKEDAIPLKVSRFSLDVGSIDSKPKISTSITHDRANKLKKKKEKCLRDIGTQISQNAFFSVDISKLKMRRKGSADFKLNRKRWKNKRNIYRGSIHGLKTVAHIVNVFKDFGISGAESHVVNNPSGEGPNANSSLLKNHNHGSDLPMLKTANEMEINKKIQRSFKSKMLEISKKEPQCLKGNTTDNSSRDYEEENHKQWGIIEGLLNRVSQNEQESLWNRIRQLIKKKIGRDIEDEGAREICIEIEQTVPLGQSGTVKQAVVAKGLYMTNEEDVEVEIDLSLEDLEMILRRRNKKNRRLQACNYERSKKHFSSSST